MTWCNKHECYHDLPSTATECPVETARQKARLAVLEGRLKGLWAFRNRNIGLLDIDIGEEPCGAATSNLLDEFDQAIEVDPTESEE